MLPTWEEGERDDNLRASTNERPLPSQWLHQEGWPPWWNQGVGGSMVQKWQDENLEDEAR